MLKQLKSQKGFTLIELMIVVAIIGILAAIAIPNFLTYQMKSRQAEAKTNLQAIRTSNIAFQAERGCYVGAGVEGVAAPAAATKTVPAAWGAGLPPSAVTTVWCAGPGAVAQGSFRDIGFIATGNVMFRYAVDAYQTAAVPVTSAATCGLAYPTGVGALVQTSFNAQATSNLDGDGTFSIWASANDHGATDCTTGVF